jgi:hypothetical protein
MFRMIFKKHVKYRSSFPCTRASGKSRVSWNIPRQQVGKGQHLAQAGVKPGSVRILIAYLKL